MAVDMTISAYSDQPLPSAEIGGKNLILKSAPDKDGIQRRASRRYRTWELIGNCQCAIVGTCLTLSDLRALARKLSLVFPENMPIDYQIHGYFAKIAETSNRPSRLLNKLLDRRHSRAIRQVRQMETPDELRTHWRESLESGDIPGPYWAINTHPVTTKELADQMFADVHMLSHVVGASNRADIKQLIKLEAKFSEIQSKQEAERAKYKVRLEEKNLKLEELNEALTKARHEARSRSRNLSGEPDEAITSRIKCLENEVTHLLEENSSYSKTITKLRREMDSAQQLIQLLQSENRTLEMTFCGEIAHGSKPAQIDLCGRRLLYVGGKPRTLPHLRTLVENWNGEFIHHDGGIEQSINELASAIGKADAVIFPTDCVSHSAMHTLKQVCGRMMKPYAPMRTSGAGSLAAAISEIFLPKKESANST